MKKKALITGITGQDGSYLAHHLLRNGYSVYGTSRDPQTCNTSRLKSLGILDDVKILSLMPNDFRSVLSVISKVEPIEIYNLSGLTSVGHSFEEPVECLESIATATLNFLEVIRFLGTEIKFFNAGSSECFGNLPNTSANESSPLNPTSPYAVAKAAAFWQVVSYRNAYGIFAATGILGNHESPLRPSRFVTKKIISFLQNCSSQDSSQLLLGNLDVWRDWGWAPEYVEAMHLMLQKNTPKDYIIASGNSYSLREFVQRSFKAAKVNPNNRILTSPGLLRPADLKYSYLEPSSINSELGWRARTDFDGIIIKMLRSELF